MQYLVVFLSFTFLVFAQEKYAIKAVNLSKDVYLPKSEFLQKYKSARCYNYKEVVFAL